MKNLIFSAAAISALTLSSSSAFAVCPAQGEVTKVTIGVGAPTQIWIRPSTTNSNTVNFNTFDVRFTSAAVAAQGSHERVRALGDAAQCPAAVQGLVLGGNLTQMAIAPEP